MTPGLPWPVQRGPDGLWRGHGFDLGVVLLVRDRGRVLMVKKAARSGYEFSGMWTLPGGRIRGEGSLTEAMEDSIRRRVRAEAGVEIDNPILPISMLPPLTRYTVAGVSCTTAILPLMAEVRGVPAVSDASISEVAWRDLSGSWRWIAPANRVILGVALWDELDGFQRSAARSALKEAWEMCAMWSGLLQLPPPPEPWSRS